MSKTVHLDRRRFCAVAATAMVARPLGLIDLNSLTRSNAMTGAAERLGGSPTAIRPFHVSFPDTELADMKRRIKATRWPNKETVTDDSQGVPLATMQTLAKYWATEYDWRKVEKRLNALPMFVTEIDGLDIHFIHVKSKEPNALPMIVTHGWPGSVIEQLKIIEPLTNPTGHGGTAADAFDLVIPSLPGYGFSGKPTKPGWDPVHIAGAWIELMKRLGYTRWVAQGGDWGSLITEQIALKTPPGLIGIHTNMPASVPPEIENALWGRAPKPTNLSAEEQAAWDKLDYFYKKGLGYAQEMASRAQTLYALADSPVGLAAWMIDHDIQSEEMIIRAIDGKPEGLSRDDILDNITLYWLTNTAVSSARLYWENKINFFAPNHVTIPAAVSVFPNEIYPAPKSWVEKAYPKLIHFNRLPKGTHFAAWEQPELFVGEMRASFKTLRS
jgi:pimeloyl-ACP methyl ester carboxylesterase